MITQANNMSEDEEGIVVAVKVQTQEHLQEQGELPTPTTMVTTYMHWTLM